ncbi:hypothetical protein F1559_001323 [Cyanidiococcus yangmingshanensis]|uniref:CMP/dCMP-type deaminase domain-containing protein n=1 Tax=Cyanidiococcus yangmingshanensis TaxID=2690220 RepID=A0A7J7ILT9_9RHOD|nr:hypothetical protein F1559_001323 [Cyanidiococcus yangmingshanensis]
MERAWSTSDGTQELGTLFPGQLLSSDQSTAQFLLRHAVHQAREAVRKRSGGPFGAVIVRRLPAAIDESRQPLVEVVAVSHNRVLELQDPTAHAEMVATREAARHLQRRDLSDCELYTSCYPCPMCYCAVIWAKIPRFWYASESEDAAMAGFDDAKLHQHFRSSQGVVGLKEERVYLAEHQMPFKEYIEALRQGFTELY